MLSWLASPALSAAMAQRARIILASADGHSVRAMARRIGVSIDTVCLWRRRFQSEGLDGLRSRALPGRRRSIAGRRAQAIVAARAGSDGTRGAVTVTAVARAAGVSRATVRRIWEREGAAPPKVEAARRNANGGAVTAPVPASASAPAASPAASTPGAIVGVFIDHPHRFVARLSVAGSPEAATATESGSSGAEARATRRPRAPRHASARPGALLTALEAFSPASTSAPAARDPSSATEGEDDATLARPGELQSFWQRLTRALPEGFEVLAERRSTATNRELEAWMRPRRGRARLVRARTRGEWLRLLASWLAEAPASQDGALAGALGHLTDYLATWRAGSGPFVWTLLSPELPFRRAQREGMAPRATGDPAGTTPSSGASATSAAPRSTPQASR